MTDPTAPGAPDRDPGAPPTPPPAPSPAPEVIPASDPIGVPAPEPLPETLPDTTLPGTNLPGTNLPDTNLPDTNLPDTNLPQATPSQAAPEAPAFADAAPPPPAYGTGDGEPPSYAPNGFPAAASPYTTPGARSSVLGILSLVAGIVAFAGSAIVFIPFVGSILGLPVPIAAIVLGILSRKREPHANRVLSLLGIILGAISLLFAVLAIVFWAITLASSSSGYDIYY